MKDFPQKDLKFKPGNEDECQEIQKILIEEFGYRWQGDDLGERRTFNQAQHIFAYYTDKRLTQTSSWVDFIDHRNMKMTIKELRSYFENYMPYIPVTTFEDAW